MLAGADPDFVRPEAHTESCPQNREGCSPSLVRGQPSEGPWGSSVSISWMAHVSLVNREMLESEFTPLCLSFLVCKVRVIVISVSWICGEDGLTQ